MSFSRFSNVYLPVYDIVVSCLFLLLLSVLKPTFPFARTAVAAAVAKQSIWLADGRTGGTTHPLSPKTIHRLALCACSRTARNHKENN